MGHVRHKRVHCGMLNSILPLFPTESKRYRGSHQLDVALVRHFCQPFALGLCNSFPQSFRIVRCSHPDKTQHKFCCKSLVTARPFPIPKRKINGNIISTYSNLKRRPVIASLPESRKSISNFKYFGWPIIQRRLQYRAQHGRPSFNRG